MLKPGKWGEAYGLWGGGGGIHRTKPRRHQWEAGQGIKQFNCKPTEKLSVIRRSGKGNSRRQQGSVSTLYLRVQEEISWRGLKTKVEVITA